MGVLMLQGFLLGLANGTSCLAYCAPVFLPFLLSEGMTVRRNVPLLVQFLAGRLAGYLLFGLIAWRVGQWLQNTPANGFLMGTIYLVLAGLLIAYGFTTPKARCLAGSGRRMREFAGSFPALLPAILGLFTGLTLCPPFLAAFADASSRTSLAGSIIFFAAFFAGTSIFFIPIPFAGFLAGFNPLRIVGRLACGLTGILYAYRGIVLIYSGLST
jgi:sulfite exporter TauE/SafE